MPQTFAEELRDIFGDAWHVKSREIIEAVVKSLTGVPQVIKAAAHTTTLSDAGRHIYHPASDTIPRVWTIDSNANVPYAIGTVLTFINGHGAGVITLAIDTDTLRWASDGSTGPR